MLENYVESKIIFSLFLTQGVDKSKKVCLSCKYSYILFFCFISVSFEQCMYLPSPVFLFESYYLAQFENAWKK